MRRIKIIWFNPPYNAYKVPTNVEHKFLLLVDKYFPTGSSLNKYFRSIIKVSYSCMPNMTKIISGHNKKVLNKQRKLVTAEVVNLFAHRM